MPDDKKFEETLMKILGQGGVDKERLKATSSAIVNLKKQGLNTDQVFPKGKLAIDRVIINGIIDPEFWSKYRISEFWNQRFQVFPYGILNPEGFRFQATIEVQ
jgi:hypothetical protein